MPQVAPGVTGSSSATGSPAHQQQLPLTVAVAGSSNSGSGSSMGAVGPAVGVGYQPTDPGLRRRLFAGIRPLSVFGRLRQQRSSQHRSISLPESNDNLPEHHSNCSGDSHRHHRSDQNPSEHLPMHTSFHLPASTSSTISTRHLRGVATAIARTDNCPTTAMSSFTCLKPTRHRCLDCVLFPCSVYLFAFHLVSVGLPNLCVCVDESVSLCVNRIGSTQVAFPLL